MTAPRPRVLGHRGASGHATENSLAAFAEARRLGADGVELDVHATRDGRLLVHHDAVVTGVGAIAESEFSTLRQLRLANGELIPSLEEALAVLAGMEVWVEVKTLPETLDPVLLSALESVGDQTTLGVHSFDHRIVHRLRGRRPALRTGVLSASYPVAPVTPVRAAGASTLWQSADLIDAPLVHAVHSAGLEIIAWTVNDTATAQRLSALGVDALCGNYPERLISG